MIRQLRSAPNQLTLLRLIFIPFVVISVVEDRYGWALALFVFRGRIFNRGTNVNVNITTPSR